MSDAHNYWSDTDSVAFFTQKGPDQYFRSETTLLSEIPQNAVRTVLDIGCAAGRLIDVLARIMPQLEYTGIDLVEHQIASARTGYPEHTFLCGDVRRVDIQTTHDLVNATGVLQHDPEFESLIAMMIELSDKYVLFDVKLASVENNIVDENIGYIKNESSRIHYIILSRSWFLHYLRSLRDVGTVTLMGYPTPLNRNAVMPSHVGTVYSCGVLIEKATAPVPRISVHEELRDFMDPNL